MPHRESDGRSDDSLVRKLLLADLAADESSTMVFLSDHPLWIERWVEVLGEALSVEDLGPRARAILTRYADLGVLGARPRLLFVEP